MSLIPLRRMNFNVFGEHFDSLSFFFQRSKVSDVPEQTLYSTRNFQTNENQLHVKPVTLNLSSQNPIIMAARIFNKLPAALKVIEDDKMFARKLKEVLHERMLYDIHEFLQCEFGNLTV